MVYMSGAVTQPECSIVNRSHECVALIRPRNHHTSNYTLEVNAQQYTCPVSHITKTCLTVSSTSSFSVVVGEQVYVHVHWICRYGSACLYVCLCMIS